MQLIDQVPSRETSEILSKLGFKGESLFYWHQEADGKWMITNHQFIVDKKDIPAYTVAELGQFIPEALLTRKDCTGRYVVSLREAFIDEEKEAEARAKTLIYLRENKMI